VDDRPPVHLLDKIETWGVCHSVVALPITLKKCILRQKKKNYGNSNNIFTMKKYYLKKKILYKKNQKLSRYHNSIN
jgi:hypothetical protein